MKTDKVVFPDTHITINYLFHSRKDNQVLGEIATPALFSL